MQELKEAILKTLVFFDLNNHPLTIAEIYTYLFKTEGLEDSTADNLYRGLEGLVADAKIAQIDGFYFLAGREEIVKDRLAAYPLYFDRIQKTAKKILLLRYVPYIRGIAVGGSLAGMYSNPISDIDFFVIVRPGRIWLGRLLLSFATHLMGVRRYGNHVANRICLNHYIVSGLKLPSDHTIYSAVEYASLLVLLNKEEFDRFLSRQDWMNDHLYSAPKESAGSVFTTKRSLFFQPLLETVLDILGAQFLEKL